MDASSAAVQEDDPPSAVENEAPKPPTEGLEPAPATNGKTSLPTVLDENGIPLSKNKLKKIQKDREWEANRAKRKAKRKEKDQVKKERKRAARSLELNNGNFELPGEPAAKKPRIDRDADTATTGPSVDSTIEATRDPPKRPQHVQLPVTLVLDCGFDALMKDTEIKSLSSQVTRAYSDCHRAPFQAHLVVCSFGGRLRERFEGVLTSNHKSWKNVAFLDEDFVGAAERAGGLMRSGEVDGGGGKMAGAFARFAGADDESAEANIKADGEVVYLTSDSENTLTELKPYSTYVVGGIVDKNRHKGVCYKRAMDRGVKTAKLPIGEFMQMQSRFVLATNHVVEIMLRWLECGDWGKAFLRVIPKRKGGSLRFGGGDGGEGLGMGQTAVDGGEVVKEFQDVVDEGEKEMDGAEDEDAGFPDQSFDPKHHEERKSEEVVAADKGRLEETVALKPDTEMQAEAVDPDHTKVPEQS